MMPRDGLTGLTYSTANNRITTSGYSYDVAGNLKRGQAPDGSWQNYEYDAANRLLYVKDDTNWIQQTNEYGSSNQRLASWSYASLDITYYAWGGGGTLAEYTTQNGNSALTWAKSYIYFGDTVLSTVTKTGSTEAAEFNHPDRLGIRTVTNQVTGSSSEQVSLPFGTALNAESTTSLSKRFTSYDRSDISGLDYAVNRTYNPGQGRFTQVDPIGMGASSLASPQTLNLYTYCGNDPINHTDPSGLFFGFLKKLFKWILVAVAVVVAVLTIIAAPATIVGILGAISAGANAASQVMTALGYKKIGVIFGIIAAATGFGSIIAAKIKGITFASEGIKGQINLLGGRYGAFGGVGAIANSLTRTERNQRRRFPCPPSVNRIHRQFARFLAKLLVNNSEHLTNSPLENGGWIYQRKNGDLFFLRAEKFGGAWRRGAGHIDTRTNPPNIRDARVVGRAHTHPYSPGVQKGINEGKYYGGPSNEDVELSIKDQIPELVAHQTGVSSITVEAASNVYSIPDKNCNRR